jgi:hypothetical protein
MPKEESSVLEICFKNLTRRAGRFFSLFHIEMDQLNKQVVKKFFL